MKHARITRTTITKEHTMPDVQASIDRHKLRSLMQAKGFKQSELSLYSGVDQGLISKLLSGARTGVTLQTLAALAHALKVDPSDLVTSGETVYTDSGSAAAIEAAREEAIGREILSLLRRHPDLIIGLSKIPARTRSESILLVLRAVLAASGQRHEMTDPPQEVNGNPNQDLRKVQGE
jgi:transcriptional regulator with XRE-family HTH domain